ncbi:MAG: discoidin domain-containing protein, partial [Spirochaetes bacterium]|nr:discoidin domain-containing protein [Spirochaetota bacterium]
MEYITISRRYYLEGIIDSYSSQDNDINSIQNILKENGYWCSARRSSPAIEYMIVDLKELSPFDYIELSPSQNGGAAFPRNFRFECSDDKSSWEILHEEKDYTLDGDLYHVEFPLIRSRYVKILIISSNAELYYTEIGRIRIGIHGIEGMHSSSIGAGKGGENLLSPELETFWESELKSKHDTEYIYFDLGRIFQLNGIQIASADFGFPEQFHLETSTDGNIWTYIFEEQDFKSQAYTRYFWSTAIMPARYIKLEMRNTVISGKQMGARISCVELYAAPMARLHTHNIGQLTPYASIFQPGMVKLSRDGERTPGTAVQGNDSRLVDASTIFKGIVRLAEPGESSDGIAVQSSDPRLSEATELNHGIVRLGYDRENKPGVVVQGNDSRLKEATEKSFGIVRLCPDGQYNDRSVVQGNDSRIQKATEDAYGICRLANNGGTSSNTVVQADDNRLKDASTKAKGIVELAEDGEDAPNVAVQGN